VPDGDEERVDCGGDCGACVDCPKGYSFGYCFDDPDLMLWMRSDDPAVEVVPGTELSSRQVVRYPNRAVPGGFIETVGANRNPRQTGYNAAPSTLFDENSRFSASVSATTFDFLHTAAEATVAIAFKMPSVLPTQGQALLSTNTDIAGTGLGFTVSVGPGGKLDISIGNGSQVALHQWVDEQFVAGESYVLILRKQPYADPAKAQLYAWVIFRRCSRASRAHCRWVLATAPTSSRSVDMTSPHSVFSVSRVGSVRSSCTTGLSATSGLQHWTRH
jgi:hypothetical protein